MSIFHVKGDFKPGVGARRQVEGQLAQLRFGGRDYTQPGWVVYIFDQPLTRWRPPCRESKRGTFANIHALHLLKPLVSTLL